LELALVNDLEKVELLVLAGLSIALLLDLDDVGLSPKVDGEKRQDFEVELDHAEALGQHISRAVHCFYETRFPLEVVLGAVEVGIQALTDDDLSNLYVAPFNHFLDGFAPHAAHAEISWKFRVEDD
jgi:hypothetical protein